MNSEGWWKQEITLDGKYVLLPPPLEPGLCEKNIAGTRNLLTKWNRRHLVRGSQCTTVYMCVPTRIWMILNLVIRCERLLPHIVFSTSRCLPCKSLMARVQCFVASWVGPHSQSRQSVASLYLLVLRWLAVISSGQRFISARFSYVAEKFQTVNYSQSDCGKTELL